MDARMLMALQSRCWRQRAIRPCLLFLLLSLTLLLPLIVHRDSYGALVSTRPSARGESRIAVDEGLLDAAALRM
jgi:hypothetical protein